MNTNPSSSARVLPVILAGGGGTRLWPLSRSHYPKQFLELGTGSSSLLQATVQRVGAIEQLDVVAPLLVANEEHRFLIAEQCRSIAVKPSRLVLEPVGRNTAPALCAAAQIALDQLGDPILAMMPADHLIAEPEAFRQALARAVRLAEAGRIVTLGVVPERAETGYGYIETGAEIDAGEPHAFDLAGFREKPDLATAEAYLAAKRFMWNAGIFVVRASVWLSLAETFCPEIARASALAASSGTVDGEFFRLAPSAFEDCPSNSIDYAVMEPLAAAGAIDRAGVVALDAGWSDVGSWSGLWRVLPKDDNGNAVRGDVCAIDSRENMIVADHRLVATVGCEGLAIIETADSVMVASLKSTEAVKSVVNWLTEQEREERLTHRRVYRPWGSYETIDAGVGFKVKRISVDVGAALSLQTHQQRAENWVVVRGTARVTRGDEVFLLAENESTYIPIGTLHRLENAGGIPLEIIEVQSGSYLGEDDIVRFDDRYQRA